MHFLGSWLGAIVLLTAQAADDKGILGKDDLDFARGLSRIGWTDLAEGVCSSIEKHRGNDGGLVLGAKSLRIDIQFDMALREPDLKKRKDLLQEVLKAKNEFINKHSDASQSASALDTLPDLCRFIGDSLSTLIEKEEDPGAQTALRLESEALFGPAESLLRRRVGEINNKLAAARESADQAGVDPSEDPAVQELNNAYLTAYSSLARTYYYHSILLEPSDPEREKLLKQVTDMYDEIELDYANTLICFDGYVFRGLAFKDMGKPDTALSSFDAAIRLREFFMDSPTAPPPYPVEPEAADVISNAVLQKMILFKSQGDHASAIATANDYFATVKDGVRAVKGIAVLAALAEAYSAAGDSKGLEKTANKLLEVDPRGPGGERGRQLLGGGASATSKLGAENALQLAGSYAAKGEGEKAILLCQQILNMVRGSSQEANLGAETCLLLGVMYAQRNWLEEAAIAWDAAVERYPTGVKTPDALWRSINCYLTLMGKQKRGGFYEKLMRERMSALASNYPKSPYASKVQLIEVQRLENEEKYADAAAIAEKVQPGNPAFEEAEFRAGNAYYRLARKLVMEGKAADAKQPALKAETLLKKAIVDLAAASEKTLDNDQKGRLESSAFSARVALAAVYLLESINKPAEVLPLFANVEKETPDDANRLGVVWDLRFRALKAQNKMADALAMLDAAVKANPKAAGVDKVALDAATEFDTQAIQLQQKGGNQSQVDELFKKAQTYYVMGMAAQLEGREQPRIGEMEQVAGRLVVIGLHFNRVPKDVQSFVDWTGKVSNPEPWQEALKIYEALLPWTTSKRTLVAMAQTQAWLGRWKEASSLYGRIFESDSGVDPTTKMFKKESLEAMPELPYVFSEWGVVEHKAALADRDSERYDRSLSLFTTLMKSTTRDTKLWWQSRYQIVKLKVDQGQYEAAAMVLRDIERNSEDLGEKFGFKEPLLKLKAEVEAKNLMPRPK